MSSLFGSMRPKRCGFASTEANNDNLGIALGSASVSDVNFARPVPPLEMERRLCPQLSGTLTGEVW